MDLVGMAIFARVVEAGSFSRAAQRIHVSKSVVSKHVADLERNLGTQLLVRSTRSITVTEAGQEFYARCSEILRIAEEAEFEVTKRQGEPRGVLRLAAPVSYGTARIAPLLPAFLAAHAGLQVDLTLTNRAVNLIEEGFDAAVNVYRALPLGMVARRVATADQRPCAAPSYLAVREVPSAPADLASHNCLVFANGISEREWSFRASDGRTAKVTVYGNLRANNMDALLRAAAAGAGIALLPDYVYEQRAGEIVSLLPEWRGAGLGVDLVYPPGRHVAPKIRAFATFLIGALRSSAHDAPARGAVLERGAASSANGPSTSSASS